MPTIKQLNFGNLSGENTRDLIRYVFVNEMQGGAETSENPGAYTGLRGAVLKELETRGQLTKEDIEVIRARIENSWRIGEDLKFQSVLLEVLKPERKIGQEAQGAIEEVIQQERGRLSGVEIWTVERERENF